MHAHRICARIAVRRIPTLLAALAFALGTAACSPAEEGSARDEGATGGTAGPTESARALFTMEAAEWIDMSHPFDDRTLYWPTAESFRLDTVSVGEVEGGWFYSAFRFSAAEHGGTHLDAPYHFAREGAPVDEIPLGRLVGPAAVVDVSASAGDDPDYRVGVADLEAWEAEHGRIPDGALLLLDTGWAERWSDREAYLGTAASGAEAVPELHFPGLHPDAARWLVEERDVAAVGLDTPSIDYGQSTEFMSHRILYEAGIPGLENVARIDRLPPTGAYLIALPMKIGGGSGAPVRVVGVVPSAAG
ncbi:MAG: cyclase family protein [Gemmatimonadota bacterium]